MKQELSTEIQIVELWLDKALSFMSRHVGLCHCEVAISNKEELSYYQPGKLFGTRTFLMAQTGPYTPNEDGGSDSNIVFHIYAKSARRVTDFLPAGSALEQSSFGKTVILTRESHFLICKRQFSSADNKIHIYLREVRLGIATQTVLWLDD